MRRSLQGTKVVPSSRFETRTYAARRLVKVNIYEGANHRHRSSRLVSQLSAGATLYLHPKDRHPFFIVPKENTSTVALHVCGSYCVAVVEWDRDQKSHPFISIYSYALSAIGLLSENTRIVVLNS